MIELVALAAGIAAGAAAAGWVRKRLRSPSVLPAAAEERSWPVELGDVVVLDGGRGQELWLARALSLVEGEGEPFLVLFECEGPAGARAVVAFDPAVESELAILSRREGFEGATPLAPQALELDIDGAPTHLAMERRRVALARYARVEDADDAGELPTTGAVQVASYRGGARGYAVLVRAAETRLYAGRTEPIRTLSILQHRS